MKKEFKYKFREVYNELGFFTNIRIYRVLYFSYII